MEQSQRNILSVTGSDGAGGAGIQADIKAAAALGATVQTAVTTLTLQNTLGIQEYHDIPAEVVERQIDAVADDAAPFVVKIGMIRNVYTLHAVTRAVRRHKPRWVLFSPVVFSSRGERLMDGELIRETNETLIPLCSLVVARRRDAALFRTADAVLADDSHGRCNQLCTAVAVFLAQGLSLRQATERARLTVTPVTVADDLPERAVTLCRRFIELQQADPQNSRDVNYYAARLGISARYLSQVTRRVAGRSPKAIIDAALMQRIKTLLADDTQTIQQIACRLGFSTQAHLSNFFKKLAGQSPSEFRKGER